MFMKCSNLREVNAINFITNNVTNMSKMYDNCILLEELNLSNFNINNLTNMRGMFYGCSDQFHNKIRAEYKNIEEEAFNEDEDILNKFRNY